MEKKIEWRRPELAEIAKGAPDGCIATLGDCKHTNVCIPPHPDSSPGGCSDRWDGTCNTMCKGNDPA